MDIDSKVREARIEPEASAEDPLVRALAELTNGQPEQALSSLIAAWAHHPHPRLGRLIASLSDSLRRADLTNLRGKTAAARAAWDAHAPRATPAELPLLLEGLADVNAGDAVERLGWVERWMPDPRIDAALVGLLEAAPYRATSTKPFWRKLFPLLRQIRDPAQLPRLEAISFDGVAVTMGEWLRSQRDKVAAAVGPSLSAPLLDAPPIFERIAAEIGGRCRADAAAQASVDVLMQAVYEIPEDDARRLVAADALLERDDPRGELISVQTRLLREPGSRALRSREKALLSAHGKAWLGDLAPVVMADYRFERGFLAACRVDNSKFDRVQKVVGHPAWSTVHTLAGSAAIGLHPVMRSLRTLTFDRSNAVGHEALPDAWRDLLVDTERAIEDLCYLGIYGESDAEIEALCACSALPRLHRLTIDAPVPYVGRLARAPVLDRLQRLGFVVHREHRFTASGASPLMDFATLLSEARVPTLRFEIGGPVHETALELERDPGVSGYTRAHLTVGPTVRSNWGATLVDEAIKMLAALPGTVRALRVRPRRWMEGQTERLLAAASGMDLDLCEVV